MRKSRAKPGSRTPPIVVSDSTITKRGDRSSNSKAEPPSNTASHGPHTTTPSSSRLTLPSSSPSPSDIAPRIASVPSLLNPSPSSTVPKRLVLPDGTTAFGRSGPIYPSPSSATWHSQLPIHPKIPSHVYDEQAEEGVAGGRGLYDEDRRTRKEGPGVGVSGAASRVDGQGYQSEIDKGHDPWRRHDRRSSDHASGISLPPIRTLLDPDARPPKRVLEGLGLTSGRGAGYRDGQRVSNNVEVDGEGGGSGSGARDLEMESTNNYSRRPENARTSGDFRTAYGTAEERESFQIESSARAAAWANRVPASYSALGEDRYAANRHRQPQEGASPPWGRSSVSPIAGQFPGDPTRPHYRRDQSESSRHPYLRQSRPEHARNYDSLGDEPSIPLPMGHLPSNRRLSMPSNQNDRHQQRRGRESTAAEGQERYDRTWLGEENWYRSPPAPTLSLPRRASMNQPSQQYIHEASGNTSQPIPGVADHPFTSRPPAFDPTWSIGHRGAGPPAVDPFRQLPPPIPRRPDSSRYLILLQNTRSQTRHRHLPPD